MHLEILFKQRMLENLKPYLGNELTKKELDAVYRFAQQKHELMWTSTLFEQPSHHPYFFEGFFYRKSHSLIAYDFKDYKTIRDFDIPDTTLHLALIATHKSVGHYAIVLYSR